VSYKPPVNKLAGAMTPDLYGRIVTEVPTLRTLTLQGLGEPLLSPYLLDQVRVAKAYGIRVGFNSNATLLTRRRADELVAAGLDGGSREVAAGEALWNGADCHEAATAFAAAREAADACGLTLRLPHLAPELTPDEPGGEPGRPGCTWPWEAAYVTSAGVVQP